MSKKKNHKQLDIFKNGHPVLVEKPELRPYQLQGVEEMRALVGQGYLRIILTMPTGGGKTVVASHIIDSARQLERRVLFVVNRIELLNQTARQLARFGVIDIGVIRANDERVNPDAPVQVASIDTLRNRNLGDWIPDIVFIDECHRAMADSYRDIFIRYPAALHIGLTATPFRTDNQGLGELYQKIVRCASYSELITDGFIIAPRIFAAPIEPDLGDVEYSIATHDYHNSQLAQVMMKPKLMGNIVEEWKKHAQGRRTVCFAVNVEHSQKLAEAFRAEGIAAAHLDGKTSADERTLILIKLEKYELQVVCNCDVLSEGWDQPSVKCAVFARPTASLRLHMQQSGRILRPWDSSSDVFCDAPSGAIIIDHAGNVERHGLPHQDRHFDLQMGEVRKEDAPTLHTCKTCYLMWTGSSRICPECGAERPVEERKPIKHDEHVVLKEIDPKKVFTKQDEERAFFVRELTKARENGKKPGFAAYRFKDKYGKWPPYSWTAHAKQIFAQDADWQQSCSSRQAVRQHWESQMQQKHEEIVHGPSQGPDQGFTEEPQEQWWGGGVEEDDGISF